MQQTAMKKRTASQLSPHMSRSSMTSNATFFRYIIRKVAIPAVACLCLYQAGGVLLFLLEYHFNVSVCLEPPI